MASKKHPKSDNFDALFDAFMGMKPGDAQPHEFKPPQKISKEENKQLFTLVTAFAEAANAGIPLPVRQNLPALLSPAEALMLGDIDDMLRVAAERGESERTNDNVYLFAAQNDIVATAIERSHPGVLKPLVPPVMVTPEAADLLKKFDLPALEKLARVFQIPAPGAPKGP
jgi:hypothetical protein